MGFYDTLEHWSNRIDWWIDDLKYELMDEYFWIRLLGNIPLNDSLTEYSDYKNMLDNSEYLNWAEIECCEAAFNKARELVNKHKLWWMSEV